MTDDMIALRELLEKGSDATVLREGGLSPDAVLTGPTQAALGAPPAYRDVGFSAARSGENSPGDDTRGTRQRLQIVPGDEPGEGIPGAAQGGVAAGVEPPWTRSLIMIRRR
jgi:hypothetical protein